MRACVLCKLKTATLVGVDAVQVEIQVEVSGGIPGFHLVGLPNAALREGGVRIRAALKRSGFELGPARITVNLSPADLPKHGSAFDLPIAVGCLVAKGLLRLEHEELLLAGELSLDGGLCPVRGVLSLADFARRAGMRGVIVPAKNAMEAALVEDLDVFGAECLRQAIEILSGANGSPVARVVDVGASALAAVDFTDVQGQGEARRAAEVAAAGGHNLMLIGSPGSGKTLIARALAGILPAMTRTEAIEVTKVHSVAGLLDGRPLVDRRPFRAPHHTISSAGLVGGGSQPKPGEVSLSHNGVLFLDELPEFQRATLEALRQPVEEDQVTIVRARQAVSFPATFMLVAAMNPCPCGYRGSIARSCVCGPREAARYRARISGPLLDRFDLFVHVQPVPTQTLLAAKPQESSVSIARRVSSARRMQQHRFCDSKTACNAQMTHRQLRQYVQLSQEMSALLAGYAEHHQLSARAIHRACRVARTISDLRGSEQTCHEDICLALNMQQGRWTS